MRHLISGRSARKYFYPSFSDNNIPFETFLTSNVAGAKNSVDIHERQLEVMRVQLNFSFFDNRTSWKSWQMTVWKKMVNKPEKKRGVLVYNAQNA